jgi:hypothetical protein
MKNLLLAAPESTESAAGRGELTEAQILLKQMVLDSVTSLNTRRSALVSQGQQTNRHRSDDPISRWIAGKRLSDLSRKLFQFSIDRSDWHSWPLQCEALDRL